MSVYNNLWKKYQLKIDEALNIEVNQIQIFSFSVSSANDAICHRIAMVFFFVIDQCIDLSKPIPDEASQENIWKTCDNNNNNSILFKPFTNCVFKIQKHTSLITDSV